MKSSFDPDAAALPGSGIYGLPHTPEEARVVVLPVPFAATTSYGGGAQRGPATVFEASRQVDVFDYETGHPYEAGIAMLPEPPEVVAWDAEATRLAKPVIEAGGEIGDDVSLAASLARVNELCAKVNEHVYAQARAWLDRGKLVVTVGGDHAAPFGAIQAHAERYPGVGILHLDAHADLRPAYEGFTWSHASIMANVLDRIPGVGRLVQVGLRDFSEGELDVIRNSGGRAVAFFDVDLAARRFEGEPWARACERIVAELPEQVYLSFDIDGLDPALCPHTGTPVPGGPSFQETCHLLRTVVRSGRTIVGADLMEVVPGPDGDPWDGNVAARLLYKMIGWMLRSQKK